MTDRHVVIVTEVSFFLTKLFTTSNTNKYIDNMQDKTVYNECSDSAHMGPGGTCMSSYVKPTVGVLIL